MTNAMTSTLSLSEARFNSKWLTRSGDVALLVKVESGKTHQFPFVWELERSSGQFSTDIHGSHLSTKPHNLDIIASK